MSMTMPRRMTPGRGARGVPTGRRPYFHDRELLEELAKPMLTGQFQGLKGIARGAEQASPIFVQVYARPTTGDFHHRVLSRIRLAGSSLEDVMFESFDSTGFDAFRFSLWGADLALRSEPASAEFSGLEREHTDGGPISADADRTISGAWLSAVYNALFRPSDREDVDLPFDPDDYPVI